MIYDKEEDHSVSTHITQLQHENIWVKSRKTGKISISCQIYLMNDKQN